MTSLRETIENFQAYMLGENTDIEQEIIGATQDFKDTRLGVYQTGYFLRLLEGLSRDFPAVKKLAGKKKFEELGYDYIHSFPSTHFSVRYVGQHFPQYLADNKKLDPMWSQMAAFEWALENAIDAKDAHQLTFEEMSKLNPESWAGLKFKTHPSLTVLVLFYATPTLWQYLIQKKVKKKPTLKHQTEPTHWLIWRFNRQSYFRPMTENQFWMMNAIQKGKTFSEICSGLCEHLEEEKVVPFAAETLRTWISEGVFSEYHI
jgi:hypothetical protein